MRYREFIRSFVHPSIHSGCLCSPSLSSFPRLLRAKRFSLYLPAIFLFPGPLPRGPSRRAGRLYGRDWTKIAGAISRTHDIGENATEALIMADTRRAVAATTFYPLTQDSHYTNVPPIIGPQVAGTPLPRRGSAPLRVSQSLQSESCKPTRKSNSSILLGRSS